MEHLKPEVFESITTDKLKIKRLEKLLFNPLIDKALARAALFYVRDHALQNEYLDLRVKVMEEKRK